MTDTISIQKLKVQTIIGIHDWEKKIKQTLLIDLDLSCDSKSAANTDDIKDAVDYAAVSESVKTFIEGNHYQLIETLANKLCEKVLQEFSLQEVALTLHKPGAVPDAQGVSITIKRGV